jgi:N4-gp56 family major capsid protein
LATITLTKTSVKYATAAKATAVTALNVGAVVQVGSGNLYGSSKDVGTISGKLPALGENGGRVNRVGFKRKTLEGTFEKFGFFDEYTQESLDFDSDADLAQHINREMVSGAVEMTEDMLQIDLLNSAGVIRFAGTATSNATMGSTSLVSYGDLMRLAIDLDNNRTPKQTTMFTGTRMVDTKTIPNARSLYVGSELIPTMKAMKDLHNNPAFIPVEKYAGGGATSAGTYTMTGEIGAVDAFRIVVVPEMMKWAGAGADVGSNTDSYQSNGKFDVFPMLCVGEGSFTTISFQTDGKGVKFKIYHKKPGEATADRNDPYGETGFMSIKWYYGFMVLRPERIGLIKTVARL